MSFAPDREGDFFLTEAISFQPELSKTNWHPDGETGVVKNE